MVFHEIYGSYFNVVAAILTEAAAGRVTPARIRQIIEEKAYLESTLTIPDALKMKTWPLLADDGSTPIRHAPTMPLTDLEKMWLKAIAQDPRIALFDPPVEDLESVEPLFEKDFFVYYDRYTDGDPYDDPAYREHFRLILTALREGLGLKVSYAGPRGRHDHRFVPERLEYSAKDDKFRLIGYSTRGRRYAINVARIRAILLTEMPPVKREPAPEEKQSVTMILTDERNALERAMIHFSDLEKETVRLDEKHYQVTLMYRQGDETEILIRILAFGPKVRVTGPDGFIKLIEERLAMQRQYAHPDSEQ